MTANRPTGVPASLPPYGVLADLYAQRALHGTPYSALPDAPVLPHVEPRRPLRKALVALRSSHRRLPTLAVTCRNAECAPS
ncbi:MAG TPA: hypothetical protein VFV63_12300 [Ilumatobacteraceae bacterium]|nr:hypothetical protein [Ilumatobacteraceae bacterium]